MITVDEHLARIRRSITPIATETLPVPDLVGHISRERATSAVDLPPWPNSAMDGYAVHASDLETADENSPVTLDVVDDIAAGDTTQRTLARGTAMRIMTGAPIPSECSAVVPLEKTVNWIESAQTAGAELPEHISFSAPIAAGANIRQAGEDVRVGQPVIEAGVVLTPNRVAALAASGVTHLEVSKRIRLAIISTGTELKPLGAPLKFGQIYDSNGPLLSALAQTFGAHVSLVQHVDDDEQALREMLMRAQEMSDVIVLTGGASVGAFDTTRLVLDQEIQGDALHRVQFDRVAMQPGKPQGFGVLDDGTYVFALPGNPVSVWVSWHVLVDPALRSLEARSAAGPVWHPVTTSQGWKSPDGREQFMPIRIVSSPGEPIRVAPASNKGSGSHLAATLSLATGIARVPAEAIEVRENEVLLMRGLEQ